MKVFISHTSLDADTAEFLAAQILKLSNHKISCWFCNDRGAGGGYDVGDNWYQKILKELDECNILLVLVTPNSHEKPWLYYESGYGLGKNKVIVPIIIGMRKEDLNSTLKNFQAFQLTSLKELEAFMSKIFSHYDLRFNSDTFKERLAEILQKLSELKFNQVNKEKNEYIEYLDEFRFELLQKLSHINNGQSSVQVEHPQKLTKFSITFKVEKNGKKDERNFILDIDSSDSFQDVTNQIFFNINDHVKPFEYLETWVIKNENSGEYYIIREVASMIPASKLFNSKNKYTIKFLKKPYMSLDSKNRMKR